MATVEKIKKPKREWIEIYTYLDSWRVHIPRDGRFIIEVKYGKIRIVDEEIEFYKD